MVDVLVTQKLNNVTETSITIDWESNCEIDCVWYSTNGGNSWTTVDGCTGLVGSYTILKLEPLTQYDVRTRVRLKDLRDTVLSETLSIQTYSYPYAAVTPDFTIGSVLNLTLYNPLNREIIVGVLGDDGSEIFSKTISDTSISGFNSEEIVNKFYSTIPRATSGMYKVKVTYEEEVDIRDGGIYTVNEDDCKPVIGECFYFNTDCSIDEIIGVRSLIVQNISSVKVVADGLKSNKSALITTCSVTINGISHDMRLYYPYDIAIIENLTIDSATDVTATIVVTDSRGITNSKSITISVLAWELPTAIISLKRQDNFKSEVVLDVNASCSDINGANVIGIKARYKKVTDEVYSEYVALQNNVQVTWVLDNFYEWDVQVVVSDKIGTRTYNLIVERGIPLAFLDCDKKSLGVNCFPADSESIELNGINLTHNIITAYFSEEQTNLTPGGWVKLSLVDAVGGCSNLELHNGGIRVVGNVHHIKISATLLAIANVSGGRSMLVTKNDTAAENWVGATRNYCMAGCSHSLILPPKVVEVQPDDVFFWYYTVVNEDDIICGDANGVLSYLTVEIVN